MARPLTIALLLLTLVALAVPTPGQAASRPLPSVPTASILGLFGDEDENEADEDEPDEGSRQARSAAGDGSGSSLPQLLSALGLGIVATVFGTRWYFRIRAWLARGSSAA